MEFKLFIDADCILSETPVWDDRIGKLYFTDLFSGEIHRCDPETGEDVVWKTGKMIGSAIPCDDPEKLLCTLEDGIYTLDLKNSRLNFICHPDENINNRYNDTRVDPVGRIFTSSVSKLYATDSYRADMTGRFYMIDTDGSVTVIEDQINQFNAMVWSSDATRMYVVDTYNQKLLCYEYDLKKGPVSKAYTAIEFGELGMPDGMSIDSEDNLYICHWTGKISVWDKCCNHKETIQFPVPYVCCGGFAGRDMKDFYVATSKYLYSEEELSANKGAGGIFLGRNQIKGSGDHFYKINK